MQLDLEKLALLGLLTAPAHYLLGRAQITKFLWSRAPRHLDSLLRCAACSGMWLGLGAGMLGIQPIVGIPNTISVLAAGIIGLLLTPVVESVLLWGIANSSVTLEDIENSTPAIDTAPIAEAVSRSALLAMSDDLQLKAMVEVDEGVDHLLRAQADVLLIAAHLGPHDCGATDCPATRAAAKISPPQP